MAKKKNDIPVEFDVNDGQPAWLKAIQETKVKAFTNPPGYGIQELEGLDNHRCDVEGFMPRAGVNCVFNLYPTLHTRLDQCGRGSLNAKVNALLSYAFYALERDGKRILVDAEKIFPTEGGVPKRGRRSTKRLHQDQETKDQENGGE